MSNTRIGVTLYTLRKFTKTPVDIARTLQKVKSIGYDNIQLSALGPTDPRELAAMLHGEGLHVCPTHVAYDRLQNNLDDVLEEHRLWGCQHLAIGAMPETYWNARDNVWQPPICVRSGEGFRWFARDISPVAEKIREAGFTFSYHNHHWELERYEGKEGLAILIEEIDTFWIQHGGGNPAAWIRRVVDRAPIIHFKDMAVTDRQPVMAEVGEGNMDWSDIVAACREVNAQWYVVEQDICAGDPFDSIAISLRNMQEMGL